MQRQPTKLLENSGKWIFLRDFGTKALCRGGTMKFGAKGHEGFIVLLVQVCDARLCRHLLQCTSRAFYRRDSRLSRLSAR
jgi:hypothetical protein